MLKFIGKISNINIINKLLLGIHRNPHILYYHLVGDHKPEYYYNQPITANEFIAQIGWLKKHGFHFVSLDELKHAKDKKSVAITTDDGFIENYTVIAPILKENNITATFFLLNNCIDNRDLMWRNKLFLIENHIGVREAKKLSYQILNDGGFLPNPGVKLDSIYDQIPMKNKEEIVNQIWTAGKMPDLQEYLENRKPYMSSSQINELLDSGFKIGSHTFSHPECSKLEYDQLALEIIGSTNALSDKFKVPIDYFAYPFGIRPEKSIEKQLFEQSKLKAFLGTKNSDSDLKNKLIWERDKMEQSLNSSLFWFTFVPLFRKLFLKPLGIYK